MADRARGCLVGGAIGDTLGYAVEFTTSHSDICRKYGPGGITEYAAGAHLSDDTQMTLYTAEGILESRLSGTELIDAVKEAYLAWLGPQIGVRIKPKYTSSLLEIGKLNQRRAPGITCLTALRDTYEGRSPSNNSKGCGGVMRVAPVGIFGAAQDWPLGLTASTAGKIAELTHLHPMSTYSSAVLAALVQELMLTDGNMDVLRFTDILKNVLRTVQLLYGSDARYMPRFIALMEQAIDLADSRRDDWDIIENVLGGGWVAEETLAIALFSVIRHFDSFHECMICAANHGGDSDSTAAVAGNIFGTVRGYSGLPLILSSRIECPEVILLYADRLL